MPFINDMLESNNKIDKEQNEEKEEKLESENNEENKKRVVKFSFKHEDIALALQTQIIGQDASKIVEVLKVVQSGISNPDRPLGVFLIVGPTGVGKTETVRLISKIIYGKNDMFCRIDMNTLQSEHYSASLTGAPPGYVGSKEGHTLFDIPKIEGSYTKPGIVLFDEVEKAGKEVLLALLNVLDSGRLRLSSGVKDINFCNSLIFMTSNLGSKNILRFQSSSLYKFYSSLKLNFSKEHKIISKALESFFEPEFINRIDCILYYKKLESNFIYEIIDLEINKLNRRIQEYNLKVELTDSAKKGLVSDYDKRYGARDIARKIRNSIEPIVAKYVLEVSEINTISIDFANGEYKDTSR